MRLIDADKISESKFHPLPYTHITPTDVNAESYKRGWNDAIDAIIADAPTVEEPHWIPCSERLPEEYGEYRITWTTSASKKRFIGDSEYEITGEWDSENDGFKGEWLLDDYIKNYPNVKVLAWKPLPEPWREGE